MNLKHIVLACAIALSLALPLCLEPREEWGSVVGIISLLNLPGMFIGVVGGRFFPPEGYIGQSPIHFGLMVIVQSVIWYLVISSVSLLTRTKK
jgi:hypothetical protein